MAGVLPFFLLLCVLLGRIAKTVVWMVRTGNPLHAAVPLAMVILAGMIHASLEDWLFAPGYYLCVFFWSMAFVFVDQAPSLTSTWRSYSLARSRARAAGIWCDCAEPMMRLFINSLAASAGGGLTYIRNVLPTDWQPDRTCRSRWLSKRPAFAKSFVDFTNVDFLELEVPLARRFWYEQCLLAGPDSSGAVPTFCSLPETSR